MSTRVVTEKDKIIDRFSKFHPGLRDLITIIMPGFDTYYMDDNGVFHLTDKISRRGVSIAMENPKNAILQLNLHGQNESTSLCFRLSVLDGSLGIETFNDLAAGEVKQLTEN